MSEEQKPETRGGKINFTPELKEQIVRLAELQCTIREIAYVMGVSKEVIERNYRDEVELGKVEGKVKLRRAQWRNAIENENVTMQIWLGKNILGQSDTPLDDESNQILPWSE